MHINAVQNFKFHNNTSNVFSNNLDNNLNLEPPFYSTIVRCHSISGKALRAIERFLKAWFSVLLNMNKDKKKVKSHSFKSTPSKLIPREGKVFWK